MKIRIGIDPGKNGFLSIWEEKTQEFKFLPVPLIGKEVDLSQLCRDFVDSIIDYNDPKVDVHCVIEDVHAKYGSAAGATFSFGFIAGAMEMLLISFGIPYTKVQPKAWQKQMWQGIPLQQKASTSGKTMVNDTKLMSLMAAKRLFPKVDLRGNPESKRSTKAHDGKVDSLLICEYCKRNF